MAGHSNHAANAAAWAAMRAEQAAAAEQRRAERAAAKEARREANRAAWWERRNMEPPRAEPADAVEATEAPEALEVTRCKVDQVAPDEWHVTTSDGVGYMVEGAGYVVTIDGEPYEVPTMEAARELIELDEETRRDEADEVARFADGMRLERGGVAYVVDHATQTTVTLRTIADGGEMVHTHKVRRGPRGQYIRPGRSRFARDIFAADMAA